MLSFLLFTSIFIQRMMSLLESSTLTALTSALSIHFPTPQSSPSGLVSLIFPPSLPSQISSALLCSSHSPLVFTEDSAGVILLPFQDVLPAWVQSHSLSFYPHVSMGSFGVSVTVPLLPPAVPFPGIPAQMSSHSRHWDITYKPVT